MKICLIHLRIVKKGGLEMRLINYANQFCQLGHEVTIFTSKVDPSISLPTELVVKRKSLKWVPKPFRLTIFNNQLSAFLKKNDFDFALSLERTHTQDHLIAANTHFGYLKRQPNKLYSLTDYIQLRLEKRCYEQCQRIYACSEMVKNEIIAAYSIPEDRIKVLYPPYAERSAQGQSGSKQTGLEQIDRKQFKRVFLFISTSHFRKGLPLLIDVFSSPEMKDHLLLVVGDRVKASHNINSPGYLDNLKELFDIADFLVHPALYEPYGQVINESLAHQCPVIVSSQCGAAELIGEKEGLIIDSLLVEDWKNALQDIDPADFKVSDDFIERNQLDLSSHVSQMLAHRIEKSAI